MNKYEQLIEHIINDETDKARDLFHNIVVEKSRDIYESLIDEEDLNEVGGNEVEELVDEVTCDEEGLSEEEAEEVEADSDMDFDNSGDEDEHEEHHGDVEERVDSLEDALDELKAEFDALMAGEEHEEEVYPGIHGDEGAEEVGAEEEVFEAEEDEEELDETIVREYVEKVADQGQKSEGGEVGAGKNASVNAKSTVAGKNDMGGSAKNLNQGQAGADVAPASKKGDLIGKVQNTAGGSKSLSAAPKAKTAE